MTCNVQLHLRSASYWSDGDSVIATGVIETDYVPRAGDLIAAMDQGAFTVEHVALRRIPGEPKWRPTIVAVRQMSEDTKRTTKLLRRLVRLAKADGLTILAQHGQMLAWEAIEDAEGDD
jgi:hypothetical protein